MSNVFDDLPPGVHPCHVPDCGLIRCDERMTCTGPEPDAHACDDHRLCEDCGPDPDCPRCRYTSRLHAAEDDGYDLMEVPC